MAIKEDIDKERDREGGSEPPQAEARPEESSGAAAEAGARVGAAPEESRGDAAEEPGPASGPAPVGSDSPTQLGTKRFVYAPYFAGAIGIAFVASKVLDFAWFRLQTYKPAIGEPRDEIIMLVSGLIGAGVATYYWMRTRARELAEEVATEMSKVTWPSRDEVTNGTVVVIITTIVSTVFLALMDRFWGFISNLVYGGT
jgi:preprotein translocase subunit SecE